MLWEVPGFLSYCIQGLGAVVDVKGDDTLALYYRADYTIIIAFAGKN